MPDRAFDNGAMIDALGTTMSNERRLEETAATLDDVKSTLDEVIDEAPHQTRPLEKAKESVDEALDTIEASLQGEDLTDD